MRVVAPAVCLAMLALRYIMSAVCRVIPTAVIIIIMHAFVVLRNPTPGVSHDWHHLTWSLLKTNQLLDGH